MEAPTPITISKNGWSARLKWHRGRRRLGDVPFTKQRLSEGLMAGASVEIDLLTHAEGGCAVLHGTFLGRESTGSGRVSEASAAKLRRQFLRDGDGAPTEHRVMLLEDLCSLLAEVDAKAAPLLQLDYKEEAVPSAAVVENFAAVTARVLDRLILSGGHQPALEALSAAVPGLRTGYDPCYGESIAKLKATGDFETFIREAFITAPKASIIYIELGLILTAADIGVDLIARCHEAGREADAWTVRKVDEISIAKVHRLMDLKVDQITTDDPEGLCAAFRA